MHGASWRPLRRPRCESIAWSPRWGSLSLLVNPAQVPHARLAGAVYLLAVLRNPLLRRPRPWTCVHGRGRGRTSGQVVGVAHAHAVALLLVGLNGGPTSPLLPVG